MLEVAVVRVKDLTLPHVSWAKLPVIGFAASETTAVVCSAFPLSLSFLLLRSGVSRAVSGPGLKISGCDLCQLVALP